MFVNPSSPYFNYNLSGDQRFNFAPSQFSPGGQYSLAPTQQSINPYQQQNINTQQQSVAGSDLLNNGNTVYKTITNGLQLPQSQTLNSIGYNYLGFAPVQSSTGLMYSGVGPAALPWAQPGMTAPAYMAGSPGVASSAGALGTTASLSSTLGAAGIGALAGNFLGKIGGNSTGGSIGGGVGAGIGMAVGGPVGAVIGGLVGGVGGGFFGNKKPATQSDEYRAKLNSDGTWSQSYQGGKNAGNYSGFGQASTKNVGDMLSAASKALGIQYDPRLQIGGGISTRHGGSHLVIGAHANEDNERFPGKEFFYDYQDANSTNKAMKDVLLSAAQYSGYTDLDKVSKWYDETIAGKNSQSSYNVPFKSKERFDAFMTKFKSQDNTNVSPTNTTNV